MMSRNFYLGCAVWGYKDWVGTFYPPGSRASDFLSLYSQRLTTVEGNTTFYSVPSADMVKRWAAETPLDFKFCLKFPKDITHSGLLVPRIKDAIAFLDHMQPLGDRLAPVFAQLPPSYAPPARRDLMAFLEALPRARQAFAVEVRHIDWFDTESSDALNQALQALGVGRVLLDSRPIYDCPDDPQVASERKKPQVPLLKVATTDTVLVRYISHPDLDFNEPYLNEWVVQIGQWLNQGKRVYFFVHCPLEARSPHIARYFQALLEQHAVPVPPLPWNAIADTTPSQLSLF